MSFMDCWLWGGMFLFFVGSSISHFKKLTPGQTEFLIIAGGPLVWALSVAFLVKEYDKKRNKE